MLSRLSTANARIISHSRSIHTKLSLTPSLVKRRLDAVSSSLSLDHKWSFSQQDFQLWKNTLQVNSIDEAVSQLRSQQQGLQPQQQLLLQHAHPTLPPWVLLYLLSTKVHNASQALIAVNLMLHNFTSFSPALQPYLIILSIRLCAKNNLSLPIHNLVKLILILPSTHPYSSSSPSSSTTPSSPTHLLNLLLHSLSLFRSSPSFSTSQSQPQSQHQASPLPSPGLNIPHNQSHNQNTSPSPSISFLITHVLSTMSARQLSLYPHTYRTLLSSPAITLEIAKRLEMHVPPVVSVSEASENYQQRGYPSQRQDQNEGQNHVGSRTRMRPGNESDLSVEHLEAYLRLFAKKGAVHASARYLNLIRKNRLSVSNSENEDETLREGSKGERREGGILSEKRGRRGSGAAAPYGVALTRYGPRVNLFGEEASQRGLAFNSSYGTEGGSPTTDASPGSTTRYNTIFLSSFGRHTGSAFQYLRDMVMVQESTLVNKSGPGRMTQETRNDTSSSPKLSAILLPSQAQVLSLPSPPRIPTPRISSSYSVCRVGPSICSSTSYSASLITSGRKLRVTHRRNRVKTSVVINTETESNGFRTRTKEHTTNSESNEFDQDQDEQGDEERETRNAYLSALHVATKDKSIGAEQLVMIFDKSTTGSSTVHDSSTTPTTTSTSTTTPNPAYIPSNSSTSYTTTSSAIKGVGGIKLCVGVYTMLMRGLVKRRRYILAARVWNALVSWVGPGYGYGHDREYAFNRSGGRRRVVINRVDSKNIYRGVNARKLVKRRRRRRIDSKALTVGMEVLVMSGQPLRAVEMLVELTGVLDQELAFASRGTNGIKTESNGKIKPDQPLINSLLYAFLKSGRPDVVFYLWDVYTPLFGIEPNAETLGAVVRAARICAVQRRQSLWGLSGFGKKGSGALGGLKGLVAERVRKLLGRGGEGGHIEELAGEVGMEESRVEIVKKLCVLVDSSASHALGLAPAPRTASTSTSSSGSNTGAVIEQTISPSSTPSSSTPSASFTGKQIRKTKKMIPISDALTDPDMIVSLFKGIVLGNYPILRNMRAPARAVWPDRGRWGDEFHWDVKKEDSFTGVRDGHAPSIGDNNHNAEDDVSGGRTGDGDEGREEQVISPMRDALGFVVSSMRARTHARNRGDDHSHQEASGATSTDTPTSFAESKDISTGVRIKSLPPLSVPYLYTNQTTSTFSSSRPPFSNQNTHPTSREILPQFQSQSQPLPRFHVQLYPHHHHNQITHPFLSVHTSPIPSSTYPQISPPTEKCFSAYLSLLGALDRRSEIAKVLGWMRALGVEPTKTTLGETLAAWGDVSLRGPVFEDWGRRKERENGGSGEGDGYGMDMKDGGNVSYGVYERNGSRGGHGVFGETGGGRAREERVTTSEYEKLRRWLVDWLGEDRVPNERQVGGWVRRLQRERDLGL